MIIIDLNFRQNTVQSPKKKKEPKWGQFWKLLSQKGLFRILYLGHTWCARQIKSKSCRFKNFETTSAPNVNETPRSFSPQPWTSLSGSDHNKSQSRPENIRIYFFSKKHSWQHWENLISNKKLDMQNNLFLLLSSLPFESCISFQRNWEENSLRKGGDYLFFCLKKKLNKAPLTKKLRKFCLKHVHNIRP